ncbi:hypothetical protein [Nocardia arthritidis]|uniref:Uncharacterized protein n=1 Tax=Nocardia arthritidis TaxID=228602 RepID=A0A6G9YBC0_9NOCA|nr:hypothetical protein [Nocardia arthritidis]QIS10502.1 hypothetical protein F5544_13065 [Nocardia arthritidis]
MTDSEALAGWAIVSKPPGSYADYSVLAASRAPYSERDIKVLVLGRNPGNSPSPQDPEPAALPWVWFQPAAINDISYLGITIRSWTKEVDATNRPIAINHFCCLPLDEFITAGWGFIDFYQAAMRLRPTIDAMRPGDDQQIPVQLSAPQPRPTGSWNEDALRYAAAALLDKERNVALLSGPTKLESRLALLDSIAELLPRGARGWLTASAWAEFGGKYRIALTFAQGGRAGDVTVDVRTAAVTGPVLSPAAANYQAALGLLCAKHGTDGLAHRLAQLTGLRERGAGSALAALEDMDLPDIVHSSAVRRCLRLEQLRKLWAQGKAETLGVDRLGAVLTAYLDRAGVVDMVNDRENFTRSWNFVVREVGTSTLHEALTRAFGRLLRATPGEETLWRLADFARRLDAGRAFAEVLRTESSSDLFGRDEVAGAIVDLVAESYWTTLLAPTIVAAPRLTAAAIRAVFVTKQGAGAQWPHELDQVSSSDALWQRASRLFQGLARRTGGLQPADIEELWRADPTLVHELLNIARAERSDQLGILVSALLPLAEGNSAIALPQSLIDALCSLPVSDPAQQARIDFLAYRNGGHPKRGLETGEAYRRALLDISRRERLTTDERAILLDFVADRLQPGWATEDGGSILDLLWQLSHPDGATSVVTHLLRRAVAEEVGRSGDRLIGERAMHLWMTEIDKDPESARIAVQLRVRRLSAETPLDDVAAIVADLYRHEVREHELIAILEQRGCVWHPTQCLEIAARTTAILAWQRLEEPPHTPGMWLIAARMEGRLGGRPSSDDVRALDAVAQAKLDLCRAVLAATRNSGEATRIRRAADTVRQFVPGLGSKDSGADR